MTPDAEARIVSAMGEAISRTEGRVMGAIAELSGHVIRIEGRVDGMEAKCALTHKHTDGEIACLRTKVREQEADAEATGQHEITALKAELRRHDDEKRKWVFYFATAAISFITGGSGIALLLKLFGKG